MVKWFLRFPFIFDRDGFCIVFAKPPIKIKNASQEIRFFIKNLQQGLCDLQLNLFLQSKKIALCFQYLQTKDLVVSQNCMVELNPIYSRTMTYLQTRIPNCHLAWEKIQTTKIAILGCGGTGSLIAEHLVAMGVQNLSLIDGDIVEETNLNRQILYSQNDCGEPKVECLRKHLLKRIPSISVVTHKSWIAGSENLDDLLEKDISFLIVCYDQPPILCQLWALGTAIKRHIPCMIGGVGIDWGSWGPLLATQGQREEYYCYLQNLSKTFLSNSGDTVRGSLAATNHIIASFMSMDIFHYLCGTVTVHSLGKRVCLNFNDLEFKYQDFCHAKR